MSSRWTSASTWKSRSKAVWASATSWMPWSQRSRQRRRQRLLEQIQQVMHQELLEAFRPLSQALLRQDELRETQYLAQEKLLLELLTPLWPSRTLELQRELGLDR